MARSVIDPDELYDSTEYMFNQAIVEDGTLYMSGQIGTDEDVVAAGPGFDAQCRKAFENVGVVLDEVGKDYGDVAKVTSYLVDLEAHLPSYRGVWADCFSEPYPCHTILGVDQLSTIADEELLIEVEAEVPLDPGDTAGSQS